MSWLGAHHRAVSSPGVVPLSSAFRRGVISACINASSACWRLGLVLVRYEFPREGKLWTSWLDRPFDLTTAGAGIHAERRVSWPKVVDARFRETMGSSWQ